MDKINDDLFDQMRKIMQNSFAEFFDDSIFDEDNKKTEGLDKVLNTDPLKDKKSRSYSISYKFGTGMKEPEIHIQGDVDKDSVDQFLKGIPILSKDMELGFKSVPGLISNQSKSIAVEPFTEVQETSDGLSIYIEMPGIGKKDIKTKWDKDTLTISAEREDIKFEKSILLSFEAKQDVKIESNNGIITVEVQKK